MRERGGEPLGILLPPLAQRDRPKPHPRVDEEESLSRELSREAVLKRLTAPVMISSVGIVDLLGVSKEEVGVKVLEDDPELEVENRLNGPRRAL